MQKVCGRTPFAKRHRDSNPHSRAGVYRFRHQLQRSYAVGTYAAVLFCARFLYTQFAEFSQSILEQPYRNGHREPRDYDFQQIGFRRQPVGICHTYRHATIHTRTYAHIAQYWCNPKCLCGFT